MSPADPLAEIRAAIASLDARLKTLEEAWRRLDEGVAVRGPSTGPWAMNADADAADVLQQKLDVIVSVLGTHTDILYQINERLLQRQREGEP